MSVSSPKKHGKLLWHQLKVIKAQWNQGHGTIDIHIPLQLYIPYEPMDETGWIIRDAICKKLIQLGWPFGGKNSLYFFYLEDYYHLQIMTNKRDVVDFYRKMICDS